jgi:hypothetical protein
LHRFGKRRRRKEEKKERRKDGKKERLKEGKMERTGAVEYTLFWRLTLTNAS